MRFSRRSRPELPPSSVTVTMAVSPAIGWSSSAISSRRRTTRSFNPRRSVDRPVPPPRATTCSPREDCFDLEALFFTSDYAHSTENTQALSAERTRTVKPKQSATGRESRGSRWPLDLKLTIHRCEIFLISSTNAPPGSSGGSDRDRSASRAILLRIEHLGEARVFLEKRKVFVVASVVAIFRAQLDRHLQILHR